MKRFTYEEQQKNKPLMKQAIHDEDKNKINKMYKRGQKIYVGYILIPIKNKSWDFATFLKSLINFYNGEKVAEYLMKNNTEIMRLAVIKKFAQLTNSVLDMAAGVSLEMLKICLAFTGKCSDMSSKSGKHPISPRRMKRNCHCLWITSKAVSNAADKGSIEILEYLKDIGAPFNMGPSIKALENDNLVVFKWLEINYPNNVYYKYGFRNKYGIIVKTFDCLKYIYSKGYIPSYDVYKDAIERGEDEFIQWLIDIKCPGTFEVHELPDDYEERLKYDLHPGDFPWLIKHLDKFKIIVNKSKDSFDGVIDVLDLLVLYEPFWDDSNTPKCLFSTIGNIDINWRIISKISSILRIESLKFDQTLLILESLELDEHSYASLYNSLISYLEEEENKNTLKLTGIMKENISWPHMFLIDLNNWAANEGWFEATEFATEIETLWEKYESKIKVLQDEKNKKKWQTLVGDYQSLWKDDMREFLAELKMWL